MFLHHKGSLSNYFLLRELEVLEPAQMILGMQRHLERYQHCHYAFLTNQANFGHAHDELLFLDQFLLVNGRQDEYLELKQSLH